MIPIARTLGGSLADLLDIEDEKDRPHMLAELAAMLERASDDALKVAYKMLRGVLG